MTSMLLYYIVGEDFSTLTGEQVITSAIRKGSEVAVVKLLIREDLVYEGTEYFTAELQSEPPEYLIQTSSTTVYIVDVHTVVCTFHQAEHFVYESNGHVTLRLDSSRPIPADFEVDVDTVFGIGNASGE